MTLTLTCLDCGKTRSSPKKKPGKPYTPLRCARCANEVERRRLAYMFRRPFLAADKRKGHR